MTERPIDNYENDNCTEATPTKFFCSVTCYQAPYKFIHNM